MTINGIFNFKNRKIRRFERLVLPDPATANMPRMRKNSGQDDGESLWLAI